MASQSQTKPDNFKVICAKDQMMLRKNTVMKLFSLEYQYENPKFDLVSLLNINIHNLLFEVNKDIIESIEITETFESKNEFDILYLFKDFGSDLGGSKTYINVRTKVEKRFASNGNTEIIFTSKSIPFHDHDRLHVNKYKLMEYPLYIQKYIILSNNHIQVIHMFKLKPEYEEELTVTMENAISIVIKKMYLRLKIAIESLKI
jgi:hypothetical protein